MRYHSLMASGALIALAADTGTVSAQPEAMPHRTVTISGEQFEIAVPYAAGHVLNEAEASVINQTFTENIRNNAAGRIKAAKEKAQADGVPFSLDTPIGGEGEEAGKTLRQVITEYADNYEFGVRSARSAEPVDPVEREARSIAREAINAKLRANGVKRKDVSDEAFEEALVKHSKNPTIVTEAKRRVKARDAIALDELDLGGQSEAEPEVAQA